jgi:hypothetical protein
MLTYEQAFGLRDNPFCPVKPLLGMTKPNLISNLSAEPLRVHEEPLLMTLHYEGLGRQSLVQFKEMASEAGYAPPAIGTQSFLSIILGPQGTGKTTLANVLVHHLKQCTPGAPGVWRVYEPWANKQPDQSDGQIKDIADLPGKILGETTDQDYCCVLIDNLQSGAEQAAFNLYGTLFQRRIAFVFLVSSDPLLLKKKWDNVRYGPILCRTSEFQADNAIGYIQHRINIYRVPGVQIPSGPDIFPFDSQEIANSLTKKTFGPRGEIQGIVTVRQLNNTLCWALRDARKAITPPAPAISLAQSYQKMVGL